MSDLDDFERDMLLRRIEKILADFYLAPLSMASVQPILDLAVELNPELKNEYKMPEPIQPLVAEGKK